MKIIREAILLLVGGGAIAWLGLRVAGTEWAAPFAIGVVAICWAMVWLTRHGPIDAPPEEPLDSHRPID